MAARRVGVQVEADIAVLLDALDQLGEAGGRVHPGALRQHRRRDEVVREELGNAVAQLVADRRPGAADLEVANVMGHEAGPRAEDRQVTAALAHELKLVGFNRFAQFVVADHQFRHFGHAGGVFDTGDLAIPPIFQRLGCGGVVAVAVDDEGFLLAHGCLLVDFLGLNVNGVFATIPLQFEGVARSDGVAAAREIATPPVGHPFKLKRNEVIEQSPCLAAV